ncbi:uncharacterized protein DUF1837 [Pseudoduganella flava]|uniref:DUF1837 domain-containing protein n=2 Tax=Pseudoduganella flava TaxID=871742 RepID=A0A562PFI9_9BURK|nr:DUF1837 domain-containing protein [Pseudoduganella flava]TWI43000.1 uncharacterized protein DUF1837 [Pseudoduganella flava]
MSFQFEILFDDMFSKICNDASLAPVQRKRLLSLVNGYEDGKWRSGRFHSFIWDNIAQTALTERERSNLVDRSHSALVAAARNLRLTDKEDDISEGSELAEIVLYGVMKHYYKALPVVPKIFYKQNTQDNAKGADSVHIVVTNDDFSLWFGEAKFYNSIDDTRLGSVITSIRNAIDTGKLKKENAIITNVNDLDDLVLNKTLLKSIKAALDSDESIDKIVGKLHVPILLIHECGITNSSSSLDNEYREKVISYHTDRANAYFKKQIAKLSSIAKYPSITFHLILLPVPNKKAIVSKFIANVEHYKGQE